MELLDHKNSAKEDMQQTKLRPLERGGREGRPNGISCEGAKEDPIRMLKIKWR